MWFEPLKINSNNDPVAILAIPAIFHPEIDRNSRNSRNSNAAIYEIRKSDLSGIAEIAKIAANADKQKSVNCGQCLHFKSLYAHGKGTGSCLIGGNYGAWSETRHYCDKFEGVTL
jgi:hypothetical protein